MIKQSKFTVQNEIGDELSFEFDRGSILFEIKTTIQNVGIELSIDDSEAIKDALNTFLYQMNLAIAKTKDDQNGSRH